MTAIPLSGAYLGEREEELVLEVLRSGRLSLGPMIDRFEEMIAERVGAPYAVALSSGTAGLHLLCRLAGIQPGDEVITSPVSFVASANCFILEGGTPVFADVDPRTLNMDPAAVEAAITERTKAIVAVDMFGYPCELDELRAIADRHGVVLIEDAAEALGAEYKGRPIGSHGPSAVFGFYPNKQITTGEGGVVVTHSEEERRQLVSLRNQGRSYEGGGWFHHVQVGLQLPLDGHPGGDRHRAAREARRDPVVAAGSRRAVHGAPRRRRGNASRRKTTPITSARGSSMSSSSTRASTATASWSRCARTASPPPSTSRACTFSRTCGSSTASRKATAPWPRTSAVARSRCRSTRGSRKPIQERVVDTLRRALG